MSALESWGFGVCCLPGIIEEGVLCAILCLNLFRLFKSYISQLPCGPQTMSDSLMYRLTYYRFADAAVMATGQRGYDRVRNAQIGLMDFK